MHSRVSVTCLYVAESTAWSVLPFGLSSRAVRSFLMVTSVVDLQASGLRVHAGRFDCNWDGGSFLFPRIRFLKVRANESEATHGK